MERVNLFNLCNHVCFVSMLNLAVQFDVYDGLVRQLPTTSHYLGRLSLQDFGCTFGPILNLKASLDYNIGRLVGWHFNVCHCLGTEVSLDVLPFEFLHDPITIFQLDLVLFDLFLKDLHLLPYLFVLFKELVSLRFEVVKLIA